MKGMAGRVRPLLAGVWMILITSTTAFFEDPNTIYIDEGDTVPVALAGPPGISGSLNVQTGLVAAPAVAAVGSALPVKGSNLVTVNVTGLQVGTTQITFSGTFNGANVSAVVNAVVRPKVVTVGNNPFVGLAGDPVNTATGEAFGLEAVDLDLAGPQPLRFVRYSASRLAADGRLAAGLGLNRSHNFASKMEITAYNRRQVVLPNGRVVTFQKMGAKWNLVRPLDVPWVLVQTGAVFILAEPRTQQMWTYDSNGRLTKIEDGRGNSHTLAYNGGGQLSSVVDGLGRSLTLTYTSGLLTSVTDHTGRQVQYDYTGGVLVSATDVGGHTTTYGNDGGLPTAVTRPEGNTLLTRTYAGGKVASQTERGTDTGTLAYGVGTTTFTDPAGETLTDTYDAQGRLASHVDELGNVISMTSDAAGRRASVTDREGHTTTVIYHAGSGRPATIINAEGKSTLYTYKSRTLNGITFHDLGKIAFPDGSSLSFTYDAKGNLTQVTDQAGKNWKHTYNARGQMLTSTNPAGGVTTRTYDGAGNLASVQDPDTGATTFTYDNLSRPTSITSPLGGAVLVAYDTKGRVTSITDERGKVHTLAWDMNNRLTSITNPDAHTTSYVYDVLDRVQQITDRNGRPTSFTYNSRRLPASMTDRNGNTVTFGYDERQMPVQTTDAGGETWVRTYDDEGLLISAASPINPAGRARRNRLGRVVEVSNPLGHTRHWVRDAMQRVTQVFDEAGRQTLFTYDKRGLLTSAAEQGTAPAKYDYDGLGRLVKVTDPGGGIWTYGRSTGGRPVSMKDPLNRLWTHAYDARGRLSQTTFPDGGTRVVTYDTANNVTRLFYSGAGPDLNFSYDNVNRLATAEGLDFTYDPEGRVTAIEQDGDTFAASYDHGGRLASVSYMNGSVVVSYQYDSRNRLTRVTDSETTTQMDFAYDDAGRVTGITRSNGVNCTMTYDAAGRLTRIQDGTVLDLQYTLNPAGEVVAVDHVSPLPPAPAAAPAQLFKHDKAGQISLTGYAYDLRGRLTAAPGATYGWDGASRLTNANGVTLEYNGLNTLERRTAGAAITRFFNHYALGLAPIVYEEPESGGGAERAYVWTPGGRLLYSINMVTAEATFYHFDHLGSTLALTDDTGAVTDSYAYGPHGELLGQNGTSDQPFLYVGALGVRREGALYHMRARYYDPATARFLSRDPRPPRRHRPKTTNPYQYAEGDPLSNVDPLGADSECSGASLALFFSQVFTGRIIAPGCPLPDGSYKPDNDDGLDVYLEAVDFRGDFGGRSPTDPAFPFLFESDSATPCDVFLPAPAFPVIGACPLIKPPGAGSSDAGSFFPCPSGFPNGYPLLDPFSEPATSFPAPPGGLCFPAGGGFGNDGLDPAILTGNTPGGDTLINCQNTPGGSAPLGGLQAAAHEAVISMYRAALGALQEAEQRLVQEAANTPFEKMDPTIFDRIKQLNRASRGVEEMLNKLQNPQPPAAAQ